MGVDSVFDTDILRSLIAQVEEVSGKSYDDQEMAPAFHVIADHIRSLSFAIADGVQPSNIDRGYVLRKILRRAVRYGRMLGMQEPFLANVLPRLISTMGSDYPELKTARIPHRGNSHRRRRGVFPHAEARREYFKHDHDASEKTSSKRNHRRRGVQTQRHLRLSDRRGFAHRKRCTSQRQSRRLHDPRRKKREKFLARRM